MVSIIITCYNLGQYLEDAIESAFNSLKGVKGEVIIVNDGSTDRKTKEVLQYIKENYTNVHVLNQDNQGLGNARNNGIALAKGEYIIPLDADNKLHQIFIQEAVKILDQNNEVAVVYGNAQFFGLKEGLWKSGPFDIKEMVLNNYIDACACFRKSAWESVNGFDAKMPLMGFEDWDFWLRLALKGYEFKYVDELFFDYRVREGSMLTNAWGKRQILVDYIFNKTELRYLGILRQVIIENQKLKEEPAVKTLVQLILKKIKRHLRFK